MDTFGGLGCRIKIAKLIVSSTVLSWVCCIVYIPMSASKTFLFELLLTLGFVLDISLSVKIMAIGVVEFSREGYKIRKVFA